MREIEQLNAEHRQIAAMAHELAATVAGSCLPDPLAFLQFRREFGRMLTRHLRREEWSVYPRLIGHRDEGVRRIAAELCAETETFSLAYAAYSERWTAPKIAAEWEAFRAETLAMIERLLDRIEVEDNRLYPLLTQAPAAPAPQPMRRFA